MFDFRVIAIIAIIVVVGLALGLGLGLGLKKKDKKVSSDKEYYTHGAVATDAKECSEVSFRNKIFNLVLRFFTYRFKLDRKCGEALGSRIQYILLLYNSLPYMVLLKMITTRR